MSRELNEKKWILETENLGITFNADKSRWLVIIQKLDAIKRQISRAMILYLDERDYLCSISLAGSGYSLIREMLKIEYQVDDIGIHASLVAAFTNSVSKSKAIKAETLIRNELSPVNWLKHYNSSKTKKPELKNFDEEEIAEYMVENALFCYGNFVKIFTPNMPLANREEIFSSEQIVRWVKSYQYEESVFN
jgi:hypothetical protein